MSRRRHRPAGRKPWQPLEGGPPAPEFLERLRAGAAAFGVDELQPPDAVWINDAYQVLVRTMNNGILHLSIHRHDRRAVRDWRHLQQIKNEVAGPERWGFEVFPPESQLVDSSNEYHLWVMPAGVDGPGLMGGGRLVYDAAEATADRVAGRGRARQRPFQPGLTTGGRT